MLDVNLQLITYLKAFISEITSDTDLFNKVRLSPKDFTRNRKLPFEHLVYLISKLCKKTLSVELEDFFSVSGYRENCTVSGFVQQRLKLNPHFFSYWNKFLYTTWYALNESSIKRWNGYRLVAADGSNVTLINKPILMKHFGGQRNQSSSYTVAKTFYHYDVLNELILTSQISPFAAVGNPCPIKITDCTRNASVGILTNG